MSNSAADDQGPPFTSDKAIILIYRPIFGFWNSIFCGAAVFSNTTTVSAVP